MSWLIDPDDRPTRAEAEADERGWEYSECPECGETAVDPDGVCHAHGPDEGDSDE
jgi:hypothetical protein